MSVSINQIAWLAGFLEGEGYFGRPDTPLFFAADSTDQDVIDRMASLIKVKTYGPYENGSCKDGTPHKLKYRAQVNGKTAAGWMMTLFPLMGTRRQQQIKSCLLAWRERPIFRGDRTRCPKGHPLSGDNLYVNRRGMRSCRQCQSRSARLERKLTKQTGPTGNKTDGVRAAVASQNG
jgi:hypothetical protein